MKGKEGLLIKTGSWLRKPLAHKWHEMLNKSYKSLKAGKLIQGTAAQNSISVCERVIKAQIYEQGIEGVYVLAPGL